MRKEYFEELFKVNKTVIIPGIGAFTKHKPTDRANFNAFLKFNDGLLVGFISKKQNISVGDAGKMLDENVKKINAALISSGKVSIAGLGILTKGKDGKVSFAYDANAAESVAATETIVENITKENRVVHEIKKDAPKVEVKDVKKPLDTKPVVDVKKEANKVVAEVKKEEVKVKEDPRKKFIKEKPPKKVKDPNRKRKKLPIVWIIVFVVVAGVGTFAGVKWEMVKGWFASAEKKEVKKEITEEPKSDTSKIEEVIPVDTTPIVEEKIIEETPIKEKPIKEKPIKEKPIVNNTPVVTYGDFHVIVNCYQSEANANKMVSKLSEKGFQAQNLGNRGGFFMVSAGSASSMDQAKGILDKARGDYPKAWIYSGK